MTKLSKTSGTEGVTDVGGTVDEIHVTVGIYGDDLDPAEMSRLLGCAPTMAHRRGEPRRSGRRLWHEGAWILMLEGLAPVGADELIGQLSRQVPGNRLMWSDLASKFRLRVSIGLFVAGWHRGCELSPQSWETLAMFGVPIGFEIYADAGAPGA